MNKLQKRSNDPRIKAQLEALNLEYEISNHGAYELNFEFEEGRCQKIWIESDTETLGTFEIRNIWSCAFVSDNPLPGNVTHQLLMANRDAVFGAWSTFEDEGETFLVFEAKLPTNIDVNALKTVVVEVATTTDELEKLISGEDIH
jgi:hypothetical protein